ncbi:2OG-Fe dioxygenase family protein [Pseudomonas mangiferae]|uniref:2OG-Fe dioxygenase family protein n=1 Tax=Pseudomonas mangiferae TaxID=2593654 RepID=A0A553GU30_9PSED|nr:2OG-Fe dioxygenase family protein [Pseudomonas mangiferae]TRX73008.1 hypothetical protein FM069_20010 [Pseudomonas mangiferae]
MVTSITSDLVDSIAYWVRQQGYASVGAADSVRLLSHYVPNLADELARYQRYWDELPLDRFMADGGRYRYRRFSCLGAERTGDTFEFQRQPSRPFYQSTAYNALNGGQARVYEELRDEELAAPTMQALFALTSAIIHRIRPASRWDTELHPIRTVSERGRAGEPTPEGVHQDGVDYFFAILIDRKGMTGGVTQVLDAERRVVFEKEMRDPLEFLVVDDRRLFHGVSSCFADSTTARGHRDTLIFNYRLPQDLIHREKEKVTG